MAGIIQTAKAEFSNVAAGDSLSLSFDAPTTPGNTILWLTGAKGDAAVGTVGESGAYPSGIVASWENSVEAIGGWATNLRTAIAYGQCNAAASSGSILNLYNHSDNVVLMMIEIGQELDTPLADWDNNVSKANFFAPAVGDSRYGGAGGHDSWNMDSPEYSAPPPEIPDFHDHEMIGDLIFVLSMTDDSSTAISAPSNLSNIYHIAGAGGAYYLDLGWAVCGGSGLINLLWEHGCSQQIIGGYIRMNVEAAPIEPGDGGGGSPGVSIGYPAFPEDLRKMLNNIEGGPEYSTMIGSTYAGHEQRNRNWLDSKGRYRIALGQIQGEDFRALEDFYREQGGDLGPFLWIDPFDHSSGDLYEIGGKQRIGRGDGGQSAFQLIKHYISDKIEQRIIRRPRPGSLAIFLDGIEMDTGAYSIDYNTGVLTFGSAPIGEISASYEFYILGRFDGGLLSADREPLLANLTSLGIMEIREAIGAMNLGNMPETLEEGAAFPYSTTSSSGGERIAVYIKDSASGYEFRSEAWAMGRQAWQADLSPCLPETMSKVLAYFRSHKGRAYPFRFRDWSDYEIDGPSETIYLGDLKYQIAKHYSSNIRIIKKPIPGTLRVYNNLGEPIGGWIADLETGIISFPSDPGFIPKASCLFDIMARFDADALEIKWGDGPNFSISIPLIEVYE